MKERELFLLMYYRPHHRIISLEVSCIILENNKVIEITGSIYFQKRLFDYQSFYFS